MAPDLVLDQDLTDDSLSLVAQAESLTTITTDADYQRAAEILKSAVLLRKRIEAFFQPFLDAARATVKTLLDARERELAHPAFTEERLRPAMARYAQEVEDARRAEEQAALDRARAEAERVKAARIAAAQDAGEVVRAAIIERQPTIVVVPKAETAVPKAEGIGTRETWGVEITDLSALVRAAAADPARYLQYLQPNLPALNAQARRFKKAGSMLPGVNAVPNTSTTVRV